MIKLGTSCSPDSLTGLDCVDLQRLSEITSPSETILSIYMPVHEEQHHEFEHYLNKRVSEIAKVLGKGKALDVFNQTLKAAEKWLKAKPLKGEKGRVIFVFPELDTLEVHRLPLSLEQIIILDQSPHIWPLAILTEDFSEYGVALLDSHELRLVRVNTGTILNEEEHSAHILGKHKKGGESQMRFQRVRKAAVHAFMLEVVEDIKSAFYEPRTANWGGLVIAGPGTAKKELIGLLPPAIREDVIGVLEMDFRSSDEDVVAMAQRVSLQTEMEKIHIDVEHLKKAFLGGHGGIGGLDEVIEALREARVSVLFVPRTPLQGFACPRCHLLTSEAEDGMKCPNCSVPLKPTDIVEEMVELAERTRAHVEFTDEAFLSEIDGVGALLRF